MAPAYSRYADQYTLSAASQKYAQLSLRGRAQRPLSDRTLLSVKTETELLTSQKKSFEGHQART